VWDHSASAAVKLKAANLDRPNRPKNTAEEKLRKAVTSYLVARKFMHKGQQIGAGFMLTRERPFRRECSPLVVLVVMG
jgi:hypothetical protein